MKIDIQQIIEEIDQVAEDNNSDWLRDHVVDLKAIQDRLRVMRKALVTIEGLAESDYIAQVAREGLGQNDE